MKSLFSGVPLARHIGILDFARVIEQFPACNNRLEHKNMNTKIAHTLYTKYIFHTVNFQLEQRKASHFFRVFYISGLDRALSWNHDITYKKVNVYLKTILQ